jgi:hypothetical protein
MASSRVIIPLLLLAIFHAAVSSAGPTLISTSSSYEARTFDRAASLRGWSRGIGLAGATRATAPGMRATERAGASGIPDGAGGVYIHWADFRDGTADIYLMRVTASGAPASGWPVDGLAVCTAPGQQGEGALFPDGAGGVIVGWLDARDHWDEFDIYAQRVSSAGVPQWATDGVKVLEGSLEISEVTAAPDGAGGVLLAWSRLDDIFALRIGSAGTVATGWDPAGEIVCDDPNVQQILTVTNDGSGGAVVGWGDDRNGPQSLFLQRMNATGVPQWTANGIEVEIPAASVYEAAFESLGGGHTVAIWLDGDTVLGQRFDGNGAAQWNAGVPSVLFPGGTGAPSGDFIATPDGAGGVIAAWEMQDGTDFGFHAQRVSGAGAVQWGSNGATIVSQTGIFASDLDLSADGSGGAFFSWSDERNVTEEEDLFVQRINAAGVEWAANGVLASTATNPQGESVVAPDGSGGAVVAWIDPRTGDDEIFAQRFNSAGAAQLTANGVRVVANPGQQVLTQVVQTADGGALVVWNEKRGDQYDIRVRKLDEDGGVAIPGTLIASGPAQQMLLGFIDDGAGGGIALWHEPDFRYFAQRVDGNAAPLWSAGGVEVAPGAVFNSPPRFTPDGAGGAFFAWQDQRPGNDLDVYAQRIDAGGTRQWGNGGLDICILPNQQTSPVPVSDGAGGVFIAWTDLRSGPGVVYAQRVDASGVEQWIADGLPIATFDGPFPFASPIAGTPGPSNHGIFLIGEFTFDFVTFESTTILHAQKVNGSGAVQWGTEGATVSDAGALTLFEGIVGDGAGGAYAAWSDSRNGPFDIFAQHIEGPGTIDWDPNGNVVCDASSWQELGGMSVIAGGDLVFVWSDQRGGQPDIYAHRLNTSGLPVWAANGVNVTPVTRGQAIPSLAPWETSAPERLYLGWTDNRAGNIRYAYAERLDLNGNAQWGPSGVTGTEIALASAEADAERVRLIWHSNEDVTATIYRRAEGGEWAAIGTASSDGNRRIIFEDRGIVAGARYEYRLGLREGSGETYLGAVWVEVPGRLEFALEGLTPNPVVRDVVVTFTLPRGGGAKLEWIDTAGRRAQTHELAGLSPGRHTLRLDAGLPAQGVYFLRLTQGVRSVTTRAAVLK